MDIDDITRQKIALIPNWGRAIALTERALSAAYDDEAEICLNAVKEFTAGQIGWDDVLARTQNLAFRCGVLDSAQNPARWTCNAAYSLRQVAGGLPSYANDAIDYANHLL